MYSVREIPRELWEAEAPQVPHDTFTQESLPTPDLTERPVESIIAIELDGQPWLWQTIQWVSDHGFYRGGGFFETWDERGERVRWEEVMDEPATQEADKIVNRWWDEQCKWTGE